MTTPARLSLIFAALMLLSSGAVLAQTPSSSVSPTSLSAREQLSSKDFGKLPTYIRSDTLTVSGNNRIFTYEKNVEVRQGDMTLTCDRLEGHYTEENRIKSITALGNVTMTKGETIRATGQRAIYDDQTQIVTFTESPELQQNDSILTADLIKVFLQENRAMAEGSVRVKVVKKEGMAQPSDIFSGTRK